MGTRSASTPGSGRASRLRCRTLATTRTSSNKSSNFWAAGWIKNKLILNTAQNFSPAVRSPQPTSPSSGLALFLVLALALALAQPAEPPLLPQRGVLEAPSNGGCRYRVSEGQDFL